MADSYNKKEREKKKRKKKKEKREKREYKKLHGEKTQEFMYLDENGNLTETPPDPTKKKKIRAEDIEISTPTREKSGQSNFTRSGVVKFFNTEKGYGFIDDKETDESYFVHVNNLVDEIKEKDKVVFEIGSGPKGPIAIDVRLSSDDSQPE